MAFVMRPGLERRLKREIAGETMFDVFSRGRYSTDASIYQMMPVAVVVPEEIDDVRTCIEIAQEENLPILPRGGGTSQCGQTVNEALVIDNTKYLNRIIELDVENRRCIVEPGIVLDELNRALQPHRLWFPVDVSTSSRATIGGMAANNSCGGRSIRYGIMRDNVLSIDAILASGKDQHFGPVEYSEIDKNNPEFRLAVDMIELGHRNASAITDSFPKVMRRVGGYNIDALLPTNEKNNLSHLLVGSEGTLAYSKTIELKLSPVLTNKVMGVCHFPTFVQAMDATQHLVKLNPHAVELVDSTMISLARNIDIFRPVVEQFVTGNPEALLIVEFAEEDQNENLTKLKQLAEVMGDLGFSWKGTGPNWGGVVEAIDKPLQSAITEVRKSGLNIMMSMKEEGKPVSFVEDCAVELSDLAEYTTGLTEIFSKYGTKGTWYAHASVGCLHVRPILNMKQQSDVAAMRAIAEEAFELVRKYKGSHSGEHGDGIVRSEFHEKMFGSHVTSVFREVKQYFDPNNLFNPGKIVDPPKMDDRSLFRYNADYKVEDFDTSMDWSDWPGSGGGFQGAVEMCNNNGACRKLSGGVMCPSYRVTKNETDVTRGRANTLRLAISGQLSEDALTSDDMLETLKLCVSCKACKRECPTGVDMAGMKLEVLSARARKNGVSLHNKLVAYLPRYAPFASMMPGLMNIRNNVPFLANLMEQVTDFTAKRNLPAWDNNPFQDHEITSSDKNAVVLFADSFNRYFEPRNLRSAGRVIEALGYPVTIASSGEKRRPLCCGRTFLSAGLVDQAKQEARKLVNSLLPFAKNGQMIVGLEPSCILTLRDEIPRLLPGEDADLIAGHSLMFEEFISQKIENSDIKLKYKSPAKNILLHGHCHQKAFDIMPHIEKTLELLPDAEKKTINSSCCGMAGAFGYGKTTYDTSMKMGELSLFPAVREAEEETLIVADGISCRHQIHDGTGKKAVHMAHLLDLALNLS